MDPVIGRSYAEIGAEGRSQHKSQQTGAIEPLGPAASGLRLVESTVPRGAAEQSIFDGLDIIVPGLARLAGLPQGTLRAELAAIDAAAQRARSEYRPARSGRTCTNVRVRTSRRAGRSRRASNRERIHRGASRRRLSVGDPGA
jgi:hypothetical protein